MLQYEPVTTSGSCLRVLALLFVLTALPVIADLSSIGCGKAIVFSPDLAPIETCSVYERLGFVCIRTADWTEVFDRIADHNRTHKSARINLVVLEAHGTNGNGLKLQAGVDPRAARSYVSLGALQERLAPAGVTSCIVSACNADRLARPQIFDVVHPTSDPLFLPATLGIVNARNGTPRDAVRLLTRATSHIETLAIVRTSELPRSVRAVLSPAGTDQGRLVVSELLMQLLLGKPSLVLRRPRGDSSLSRHELDAASFELLLAEFKEYLNRAALDIAPE